MALVERARVPSSERGPHQETHQRASDLQGAPRPTHQAHDRTGAGQVQGHGGLEGNAALEKGLVNCLGQQTDDAV